MTALVASADDPYFLSAATYGDGVKRSLDGGRTWQSCLSGLRDPFIWSLTQDPRYLSRLIAGSLGSGLFISENGCSQWRSLHQTGQPGYALLVAIDVKNPDVLFVGDFWGSLARIVVPD